MKGGSRIAAAATVLVARDAPLGRQRWSRRAPELGRMDRLCGLALCATDEALLGGDGGGTGPQPGRQEDVGVFFGSAHGCHRNDEDYYRGLLTEGPSPRLFVYTLASSPAGEIAIYYGLGGPSLAVVNGVTSGLAALQEALVCLGRRRAPSLLLTAAEAGSPLLDQLTGAPLHDGAATLLLAPAGADEAGLGHVIAAECAFRDGDPAGALAAAAHRLSPDAAAATVAYCDAPTAAFAAALPWPLRLRPAIYPEATGAVGALCALARLHQEPEDVAVVLSADPRGHAAAALWARRTT